MSMGSLNVNASGNFSPRSAQEKADLYDDLTRLYLSSPEKYPKTNVGLKELAPQSAEDITSSWQNIFDKLKPPDGQEVSPKSRNTLLKVRKHLEEALQASNAPAFLHQNNQDLDQIQAKTKAITDALKDLNAINGMPVPTKSPDNLARDLQTALAKETAPSPTSSSASPVNSASSMPPASSPPPLTAPVTPPAIQFVQTQADQAPPKATPKYKQFKPPDIQVPGFTQMPPTLQTANPPGQGITGATTPPSHQAAPPKQDANALQQASSPTVSPTSATSSTASPKASPLEGGLKNQTGAACFSNAGMQLFTRSMVQDRAALTGALQRKLDDREALEAQMNRYDEKPVGEFSAEDRRAAEELQEKKQQLTLELEIIEKLIFFRDHMIENQGTLAQEVKREIDDLVWQRFDIDVRVQNDASEYLRALFSLVEVPSPQTSVVTTKMSGEFVKSRVNEREVLFSLNVTKDGVQAAINQVCAPTVFTGANQLDDDYGNKYDGQRTVQFDVVPDTISFSLQQVAYDQYGRELKQKDPIPVQETITIVDADNNQQTRSLTGCICQYGELNSGHYVSYIKDESGQWYCYDDAKVTPVTEKQALTAAQNAYVLTYSLPPEA